MKHTQIYLLILFVFASLSLFGQRRTNTDYLEAKESVVVGQGTKTTDAILDIISTDKGAILPRLTETQRDNLSDEAGLIIYNTTAGTYQYNNGGGWIDFGTSFTLATLSDSLDAVRVLDTIPRLLQDSIFARFVNGVEVDRDTISVAGTGGGSSDYIKVATTAELVGKTAAVGDYIYNYETGATYKVQADSIAGYEVDSIAVAPVSGGYAVIQIDLGIDVKQFGAKDVVPFNSINNPTIPSYTPSAADASDLAIYRAILFASLQKIGTGTANKRILFEGNFLVQDSAFVVPNGVEIWMIGNSYVHSNHNEPIFTFDSHFGTSHRVKVTHKFLTGSTTAGIDWFPVSPATTEEDSTSVGIKVLNSRRCTFYDVSAISFNRGIFINGVGTGTVENRFYLSDIRNCRWGIYLDGDSGGWAHQNYFEGGRIKLDGTINRNRDIDIDCGAIYTNGDNCTFQGVNLEGSAHYKYAVYCNASSNKFYNCRFESIHAHQIVFATNARSNLIDGSYGFVNISPWAKMPLYYSSDGSTYVQDGNGDDVYGRVIDGQVGGYTVLSGGSGDFAGSINGVADDGSGENTTLRLSTGQVGSEAAKYIETKLGASATAKTGFEIDGTGILKYWGTSASSGYGKELKTEWEERGYTTTDKDYNEGEWYQRGDFVSVDGTSYLVSKSFLAADSLTEISTQKLVANTGRKDPLLELSNSGAWIDMFVGKQKDGNSYLDLPAFINGLALTMSSNNTQSVSSYTVASPGGKSGIAFNNTTASDVTITLSTTDDYESGHIFFISNYKNSLGDIIIDGNSTTRTINGGDYSLKPYESSLYIMYNHAGTRLYHELARSTYNNGGTTAQRPTLDAQDFARWYWDSDLDEYIYWDGSAWVIRNEFTDCIVTGTLWLNSGETLGIFTGTGSPEGVVSADVGSTFHRTDGGTSTTLYVKESGTGNTGWVAK
jgi:hypothetical protein